jgi:hypothetical protein
LGEGGGAESGEESCAAEDCGDDAGDGLALAAGGGEYGGSEAIAPTSR